MSTATSAQPTSATGPASVLSSAPGVSPSAVSAAIQAIKDAGVNSASAGNQIQQDPQLMSALLTLIQNQAQKESVDQVKEAAAETLSNLSQAGAPQPNPNIHPQLQDAGPSTHPHGPPSLGQAPSSMPPPGSTGVQGVPPTPPSAEKPPRRRAGPPTVNGTIMGSEEWARQRKDNHKEVERRRRSNINEGINELARIVPNGSGEKAKGAILSRSVQYIHHLKENEARNIEKWTLEKLLMDQAMGDLQAQLEDMRRMYQEELQKREKADAEIAALKAELAATKGGKQQQQQQQSTAKENTAEGETEGSGERGAKRPRVDA